ncbi:M12 family metallo-peptidase [Flavihumibacter stibioxidans]|uniref:PKD domain-containing protein n=1 Tax=Flavihumibacter stibioxidans TaxID=1834163 RepID=A0ABR7M9K9_9BACT|nr:M12 family metallo-peptidase [Flavihumibacter stibioxidans]MBC6491519.1 hypothetical protein [Flavihumibacter stibioxidans]
MTTRTFHAKTRLYAGILTFVIQGMLFFPVQSFAQQKFSGSKVDNDKAVSLTKVFRKYTLFNINMGEIARHAKAGGKGTVNLVLDFPGFEQLALSLNEQDIFSSDYQLVLGNPGGRQKSAKPDIKTYSGKLAGDESSSVYLTISDKTIYGFIKGNGKEYYMEPLRYFDKKANPTTYVLYEAKDVIPQSGVMCAVTEADQRDLTSTAPATSQMETLGTATGTCKMIEMAIASDASMVDKYGSVQAVEEHNISVLYMMVGLYGDAQIGSQYLGFSIKGQYISTNTASDPYSPTYSGPDAGIILNNFSTWGFAGNFGFSYDLGQVWTARDIGMESPTGSGNYSYGTIGLAWVGTVCNARFKHQLLEDVYSSSMAQAVVAAHETGHNLSANHDASGAPYIMAPSTSPTGYATSFSPASLTSMNNYLGDPFVTCLSGCVPAPTIALFNMSSSNICTGNSINFTNASVGENLSYSWSFPGGNPASSTNANPVVSYSTSGTKTITLTVSNANGTSSKTKEIFVADAPGVACSQNTAGNGTMSALFSFSLRDIQYSTNTYYIGRYFEDLACTNNTRLQPATNYSFISNTGYSAAGITNNVQLFIDYNNDGDFSDANESVYFSAGCVQGTSTNSFTTPANPPVKGAWLRLRFMTIPCGLPLSNGCTIPDNASVRDFAVYFPEECPVVQLPTAAEQATVNISGAGATMLRSATCGLLGALLPNGASPVSGVVDAKVWIEPIVPTYAGLPYVARHYEITPAVNAAAATGRVTQYFLPRRNLMPIMPPRTVMPKCLPVPPMPRVLPTFGLKNIPAAVTMERDCLPLIQVHQLYWIQPIPTLSGTAPSTVGK